MKTKNYYLLIFIVLCIVDAIYEGLFYWFRQQSSVSYAGMALLSPLLLTMWVDADSKEQPSGIYRPYDFGFLVLLFLWLYLPYYFWRTRGAIGVAKLGGLAGFFCLSYAAPWIIYLAR